MSRLVQLLRLDAKLAWEHKLVHVTLVVAALFGALLRFAVPESLGPDPSELDLAPAAASELASWATLTELEPGSVKPPFNQLLVAVLYALDLCILGYMFASVMHLQDKEYGTIRYFRVSPGRGFDYVASKLVLNIGLSLLNFVILTGFVAPHGLLLPRLWLLVTLICAGLTLLGLTIAIFMRTIAQWFFPMIVVSAVLALPTYLVFAPTQALAWTWWLPTYHILFGAEAILFSGQAEVIHAALAYGAALCALTALACALAVDKRMLKEVH